jgi:hypothetical protein
MLIAAAISRRRNGIDLDRVAVDRIGAQRTSQAQTVQQFDAQVILVDADILDLLLVVRSLIAPPVSSLDIAKRKFAVGDSLTLIKSFPGVKRTNLLCESIFKI